MLDAGAITRWLEDITRDVDAKSGTIAAARRGILIWDMKNDAMQSKPNLQEVNEKTDARMNSHTGQWHCSHAAELDINFEGLKHIK